MIVRIHVSISKRYCIKCLNYEIFKFIFKVFLMKSIPVYLSREVELML